MQLRSFKLRSFSSLNKWPYIFLMPYIIMYSLFFLYPTIFSFYTSLTDWNGLTGIDQKQFVFFENYKILLTQDHYFFKSILNTFLFMIIYIPIVVLTGLFVAVLMYRLKSFKAFFQTSNILPYITTPAAIGLMFAFMFDWSTGIVNKLLLSTGIIQDGINWLGVGKYARTVLIMILIWKNFGYYFIIYLAGLSTLSKDIMEAAVIDGAGDKDMFFYIIVPHLKSITLFLTVTSIVGGFQLFDEAMLLFTGNGGASAIVGGPDKSCLTGMVYFYDTAFRSQSLMGYGAAMLYIIFVIILTFSIISFKIFERSEKRK